MYEVTTGLPVLVGQRRAEDTCIHTVDGRRGVDTDDHTVTFHGRGDASGFHPTTTFPLMNVVQWRRVS